MGVTYSAEQLDFMQARINNKISTALIAHEFNVIFERQITRNSIIGLTSRGHLRSLKRFPKITRPNSSLFTSGHQRNKGFKHAQPYQRRKTMEYPSVEPEMRKLIFWQTTQRQCKYIIGPIHANTLACGNDSDEDCSYCRYHRGIVYGHTRVETLQAAE